MMSQHPQTPTSGSTPEFTLNSKAHIWRPGLTVDQLLLEVGAEGPGVAVECNGAVIRRAAHAETLIQEGDQVEVVRLVGGG